MDPDSKFIVFYDMSDRDQETEREFLSDLTDRLANHAQLTTDGFGNCLEAIRSTFAVHVDYARLMMLFAESTGVRGH